MPRRYPSETLLTDDDFWQRAHERYIRNIPDDAEAIPIEAARDYAEVGKAVTEALRDGWHLHGGLVFDERSGMLVQAIVRNVGASK